ncbi:MAG: flippase-like domain-containing protein [Chloroflexi bacterium]|nr:flippase-like domain-containing protein [Chloroflexota bacterium]
MKSRFQAWFQRVRPYIRIDVYKIVQFLRTFPGLPGVLVSSIVFLILLFIVYWRGVLPAMSQYGFWTLLPAILFYLNAVFCRSILIRLLFKEQANFSQAFFNLNEGYLIENLLPMKLGVIGRAFLLTPKINLSIFQVRAAIQVERVYDLLIIIGLIAATLPTAFGMPWLEPVSILTLILIVVIFIFLPLVARSANRLRISLERFAEKQPWIGQKILPKAELLLEGLSVFDNWGTYALSLLWISLSWAFQVAGIFILIHGMAPTIGLNAALFTAGVLAIGVVVPSLPASLGVYEFTIVASLALFHVNTTAAMACALVGHLIFFGLTTFFGGIMFAKEGETLAGMYQKLMKFKTNYQRRIHAS